MSTYRERREARAERLRDWADRREAKADTEYGKARAIGDKIPFGQPILVGHHSEGHARRDQDRITGAYRRSFEHAEKANAHAAKASNIEGQLATSIYSDDPDAAERLQERLDELEAQRDRIKAYNASCRKAAKTGGTGDTSLLDDKQRADLVSAAKYSPYNIGPGGSFPKYALSNLTGTITRTRKRLEGLGPA